MRGRAINLLFTIDDIFSTDKVSTKYKSDVKIQEFHSDINAKKLNDVDAHNFGSTTELKLFFQLGGSSALLDISVNWHLTTDQQTIYPLIHEITKLNKLIINDHHTGSYLNNEVKIADILT